MEKLNKTQLFLFYFLTCTYSTNMLYLQLTDEWRKTGRKRNPGLPYLSLSFFVIFSISDWLIQRSNANRDNKIIFPGHFCFLEHYRFPPVFETNPGLNRKCGFGGVVSLHCSVLDVTCLVYTCFEFCWAPRNGGFASIFCCWGIVNAICKWGS